MRAWGIVVAVACAAGCLPSSAAVECDGVVCATPMVCSPAGDACVDQAQLDECAGARDEDTCTVGAAEGFCRGGVCIAVRCGDGMTDPSEPCDDGNEIDNDGCTNACTLARCGDGIEQVGEECDAGAANGDDRACTSACDDARCGDGHAWLGHEGCDDGNGTEDDACTNACALPSCGDGFVQIPEECDAGAANADTGVCTSRCLAAACDDGFLQVAAGESCDDGNDNRADGCDACRSTSWTAALRTGGSLTGETIASVADIAIDRAGNVFIADAVGRRVLRLAAGTGLLTAVAGTGAATGAFGPGSPPFLGDGGPARDASFVSPTSVAVDGFGNLYIGDSGAHRIRRVDASTGFITTVAGTGTAGTTTDVIATGARLSAPADVLVDASGDLFIADRNNCRVRRVIGSSGVIVTIAGSGVSGSTGDGGRATAAQVCPAALAFGPGGTLYVADAVGHRIRRLSSVDPANAMITTIAGNGALTYSGDGGPATSAGLPSPTGIAIAGDVIFVASGHRVRRFTIGGTISTVAGTGTRGFAGDLGPATAAMLSGPRGLASGAGGVLYVADEGNARARAVSVAGIITTVVEPRPARPLGSQPALTAPLQALAVAGGNGDVYVIPAGEHAVRRSSSATGLITTVVGGVQSGFAGDGGPAAEALLSGPSDVAVDAAGNVFIADTFNHRIRRIDNATGFISTFAGTGTPSFAGDGGPATSAGLNAPMSVAVGLAGDVYVSDTGNLRVRRIRDGVITTVAGGGSELEPLDGSAATEAQLREPRGLDADIVGNLYVADAASHRVLMIDVDGALFTAAGTGAAGVDVGDVAGEPAMTFDLDRPTDIAVRDGEQFWIVDERGIWHYADDGTVDGFGAGTGIFAGDGLPAVEAYLDESKSVDVDRLGALLIADYGNFAVRRVRGGSVSTPGGYIDTVIGPIDPVGIGPLSQAWLFDPRAVAVGGGRTFFAGGASGTLQGLTRGDTWVDVLAGRYPHEQYMHPLARFQDASFGPVSGVAYDADRSTIFITAANQVLAVQMEVPEDRTTWTIHVIANAISYAGYSEEIRDGNTVALAADAQLDSPTGLSWHAATSTLYVADTGNHVIRAITDPLDRAAITTVAGTPVGLGFFGDGDPATQALLYRPQAVTRCGDALFVADTGNNRIRRVAATGDITTVLGDGIRTSSGDGEPSSVFPVNQPVGLACDDQGNVFVTSTDTVRLLIAGEGGVVDGSGRVETIYGEAPRDTAPAVSTSCLTGIAVADAASLVVTDLCIGALIDLTRAAAPR